MLAIVGQALLILLFPALILWGEGRYRWVCVVGSVVLCYVAGLVFGTGFQSYWNMDVAREITELSVPLAIPMLLFSTRFLDWLKSARSTLISFFIGVFGVMMSSTLVSYLFREKLPLVNKLAGMVVGVYTGGTPNMTAIGMALEVPQETFLMINGADIFVGAIYLFFLLSVGKHILGRFLPPYSKDEGSSAQNTDDELSTFKQLNLGTKIKLVFQSIVSGLGALGVSAGLSLLIFQKMNVPFIILGLTSIGIGLSFIPFFNRNTSSYPTGQYLLLVFCVAIGSQANLENLLTQGGTVFVYLGSILLITLAIHFFFAWLFKLDRDTVMITSTAAIFGPPFVPPVVEVLGNRDMLVAGLTSGLMGYALGNYLGLFLSYALKGFAA